MLPRLDDIEAFLAVVETGSVTAAARRLGVAKSVVSKRLADLEACLTLPLFWRAARRLTLTDAGETFLPHAKAVLAGLSDAVDAVAEPAGAPLRGTLRLAAPVSFAALQLMSAIADFQSAHPALRIAIDVDDRAVDIAGGGYDLAIRIGRPADSALMMRRLAPSRRLICASPAYLARHGTPASLTDLAGHRFIGYANLDVAQQFGFLGDAALDEHRLSVRCGLVANSGEVMREAALAGVGPAVLPSFIVAEALRTGRLVRLLPDMELVPDQVAALWPASRTPSRRLRLFVDHLAERFRGTPPWDAGL